MIAIIGLPEKATSHTLALVMSAARSISNQLQADWSLQEANHRLSEVHTVMSTISEGIIAWNERRINHANDQAGEMLGIKSGQLLWVRLLKQVLDLPDVIQSCRP